MHQPPVCLQDAEPLRVKAFILVIVNIRLRPPMSLIRSPMVAGFVCHGMLPKRGILWPDGPPLLHHKIVVVIASPSCIESVQYVLWLMHHALPLDFLVRALAQWRPMNALDTLKERGFVRQCSAEAELALRLARERMVFYVGFDPTANSLHVGSLMPIMAMVHLQRAGHIPIAVIGGGTAQIGDPSGKTEMRQMIAPEEIHANGACILGQLQRYLVLDGEHGLFVNNADWLSGLGYLPFLRTIGRYFKVNEMTKMEAYRQRLEREEGLSFLEFNYQVLQAYDFLTLALRHGCLLQMGGDDQWGNILAGVDLIRKVKGMTAYALTFPLLTTARGQKMGKTEAGAVWLDARRTPPYDFYQYWINSDDRDVARFLAYFTLLPMAQIARWAAASGADLREAKAVLAFEATRLAHGTEAAHEAQAASRAVFGGAADDLSAMPTLMVDRMRILSGLSVIDLLCEVGFAPSKGAARRLILQGGAYMNGEPVLQVDAVITEQIFHDDTLLLRHGKKRYHRILIRRGEA